MNENIAIMTDNFASHPQYRDIFSILCEHDGHIGYLNKVIELAQELTKYESTHENLYDNYDWYIAVDYIVHHFITKTIGNAIPPSYIDSVQHGLELAKY